MFNNMIMFLNKHETFDNNYDAWKINNSLLQVM